ncbi:brain-specific serine protease 4-like [Gigantopelta aegis]|uniref:brain-specific serine protease 4-like n=1 Tax=Gigantopelta aegis TaxID=1735272 RepID=UPI001B88DE3B|nr:brain-specific serine protease 4-like [Gigantopelta aegis]
MGGNTVSVCNRPWMVHLVVHIDPDLDLPACAGVLISDTQILTSKICAEDFINNPPPGSTILAKFADSEKYLETIREITSDKVTVNGDIAMVTFSPKVPTAKDFCILPVCLPDQTTVFTEDSNQKCKIASWGFPVTDTLQEADVALMPSYACKLVLSALASVNINIKTPSAGICTDPTGATSSACKLDEGGMLLCQDQGDATGNNWILAGVTYGAPCNASLPNTFVNVTSNLDFIMSNLV